MNNPFPDIATRIIFEDENLIVFNKCHDIPTSGKDLEDQDCIQYWLIQHYNQMIWAIHQLDADTSGLNLFVKNKKAVKHYKQLLEKSRKFYTAIIHGVPTWNFIHVKEKIGLIKQGHLGITSDGKEAHSCFQLLKNNKKYSLVEAEIFTGRTHQIRIHLSHLNHPLVGEEWYIKEKCMLHPRQALHASRIIFDNNTKLECSLAPDLINLKRKLNL